MKKLLVALLAVMLVAGSAMALEFETKGMYYVRGSYEKNSSGLLGDGRVEEDENGDPILNTQVDPEGEAYYDHEFDMDVKMIVSDQTFVFLNFEIHDETWDKYTGDTPQSSVDDNIHFKRVYGSHTFSTGTQFDFGLMTGESWGTDFFNNANAKLRLKVAHPFGDHKLYAIIEKFNEAKRDEVKDSDQDDNDAYFIGLDAKLGDISIRPMIAYYVYGYTTVNPLGLDEEVDRNDVKLMLAAEGELGSIGFEGEVDYYSVSWDVAGQEDYSVFGLYLKGWTELGIGKVGGLLAYGSYDDDANMGFDMGADFCPTLIGCDLHGIGISESEGYAAVTLLQLFGEFEASEALSFGGNIAYWMSNSKDDVWEDANGYEMGGEMTYKITDAVTYSAGAAYGVIQFDDKDLQRDGTDDEPDPTFRLFHKLKISF